MKIEISTLHNIRSAAQAFLEATDVNRVFAFYGKMGAGKTTFIKALCEDRRGVCHRFCNEYKLW